MATPPDIDVLALATPVGKVPKVIAVTELPVVGLTVKDCVPGDELKLEPD